jgi:hypothetical protein
MIYNKINGSVPELKDSKVELVIVFLSIVFFLLVLFKLVKLPGLQILLAAVIVVLTVVHLIFQGPRWQMYIEYTFIVFYLVITLMTIKGKTVGKRVRLFMVVFWSVFLVINIGLLILFPYNKMPKIDGEYNVGTISFDAVDVNRLEGYGNSPGSSRKIRLQFWYPAENVDGAKKDFWLSDGIDVARLIPAIAGGPGFIFEYIARIKSNSYKNAPILQQQNTYPIVVMSHGWRGFRNLHSDLGELLASNGFIAVSIDHTFGSLGIVFDDGSVIPLDTNALPPGVDEDFASAANTLVKTYSLDAKLVLDLLGQLNEGKPEHTTILNPKFFINCIDLNSIGMFGHSTGGGGVTRLAINDERVSSVFALDPWVEPIDSAILNQGLATSSIFLRSEQWAGRKNNEHLQIIANSPSTVTDMYQLNGATHEDFTMLYMFEPASKLIGFAGTLDSRRSGEIQRNFILNFFNITLKGSGESYSSLANKYPEVVDIYWQ